LCDLCDWEERGSYEKRLRALLDQRLRFDDGILRREGVEGREKQATATGLSRDEAERGHRQAIVRRKIVQQAALATVGENLIVNVEEDFRCQYLNLKAHFIVDAVCAHHPAGVFVAQLVVQEPAFFGQFLLGGGGYFGEMNVGVFPGDDVAGPRDAYRQLVILALNLAHGEDVEQLGVKRTPIELKDEIAHSRSQKINAHDWLPSLLR